MILQKIKGLGNVFSLAAMAEKRETSYDEDTNQHEVHDRHD